VFLVVKEALLNVYKYAGVKEAKVYFAMQDRSLFLQISDQGRGFEMNKMNLNGNGIKNMEKRIHALEGTIQFVSTPGIGTIITINMKL
jgi:hypothetical protein